MNNIWLIVFCLLVPVAPQIFKHGKYIGHKYKEGSDSSKLNYKIADGIRLALSTCRKEFSWSVWNCPESDFAKDYENELTREDAYIQAIRSAAITHHLLRIESENVLIYKKNTSGCSENFRGVITFSRQLLDAKNQTDLRAIAYNSNNAFGRKLVKESFRKELICLSSPENCDVKLCRYVLAPFEQISKRIKNAFDESKLIRDTDEDNRDEIVYVDDSPDYCSPNETKSWPGLSGRICSVKTSKSSKLLRKQCSELCSSCGYKVATHVEKMKKKCNCQYDAERGLMCSRCTIKIKKFICTK